jgi:hypothetical protein
MDEHTSLINIGELSRPATVLVEKISDAVGGIFKPYQIVRVAKAEAQADRVRAEGQIEISDLQRRAFHRFLNEEAQKQKNIEEITQNALPLLDEDSKPNEVEDDWIAHFFDRCRLVSDDEMQSLWSRVLAGEANSPGAYSKRTINFLSGLDKTEAEWFTQLCGFVWETHLGFPIPVIYDDLKEFYREHGLPDERCRHLESIGLISVDVDGFVDEEPQSDFALSYFGEKVRLDLSRANKKGFNFGMTIFTKVGEELFPICRSESVNGYFESLIELWKKRGILVSLEGQSKPT